MSDEPIEDDDDCMDCGTCDDCIERSRAYAEEMDHAASGDAR
jgi:7-cyano-7-deazaguanine synthase in queuosine biosynthesis